MIITDMLGRKISVGDYVVSYNHIYEVIELQQSVYKNGEGRIKGLLLKKSDSSRAKYILSYETCILPKGDVIFGILKK